MKAAQWVALAITCAIAAAALGSVPALPQLLSTAAVACLIAPIALKKRRSQYDLKLLREVHEKAKEGPVPDIGSVEAGTGVTCPHCFELYDARLPICPNCRRSP